VRAIPPTLGNFKNVFKSPSEAPESNAQISGSYNLAWPTDQHRINQYFHSGHPGVDINGNTHDNLYAVDDGIVTTSGWNRGGYGNMILIDHGNGMITRYGHASVLFVHAGDQVVKGQVIGIVGTTGHSTGPHLHFEIYLNGRRKNPLGFYK
jgi:murein DD-endopeptidase MepM/ murein hydrolase activator NlpD